MSTQHRNGIADQRVNDGRRGTGKLALRGSVVYFAQRGRDGAIKIGTTTDLKHRIYRLRNAEHDTIEVIGVLPGNRHVEGQLHRALIDDALGCEWFKPTQRVIDAAAGKLIAGGDPDPFEALGSPPRPSNSTRPLSPGGRENLRGQIVACWCSGMSGREAAALLQVSTGKLTREVKLMSEQGYF